MAIGSQTQAPYYPMWPYWGYADLGPTAIPPRVPLFGLTDRQTGLVLYVGHDSAADPSSGIHLVSYGTLKALPQQVKVYAAYDGPWIGNSGLRLGARNGRLVFDTFAGSGSYDTAAGPYCQDFQSGRTFWQLLGTVGGSGVAGPHVAFTQVNNT